jgi:phosphopantothenoylcysteine decarboxylase/phosphopantothenate--cysteine ligase
MEIVLCVTGSVAAIEAVKLARELRRHKIEVKCFMSDDGVRHRSRSDIRTHR